MKMRVCGYGENSWEIVRVERRRVVLRRGKFMRRQFCVASRPVAAVCEDDLRGKWGKLPGGSAKDFEMRSFIYTGCKRGCERW